MAYSLKAKDDDVQAALRRIADDQLGRALKDIDDDTQPFDVRVHEARKRCKKMRGLIRLVRPAFDDYGDENAALRDAARQLSAIRDADSLIATYDDVMAHAAGSVDRAAFAPIRARLTRDANAVRADPDTARRMAEMRRRLAAVRERAAHWKLDTEGFDAVAGGLRKTYKRARKRMEDAWADPTDAAMHDWRKRVKYHWYHTRLLRRMAPQMMLPHQTAGDALSDHLGDHHDLAVLDDRLHRAPGDFGPTTDLDTFRALLQQRKQGLADQAFELGRLMLAERSKALVKRWSGYWDLWEAGKRDPARLLVKA